MAATNAPANAPANAQATFTLPEVGTSKKVGWDNLNAAWNAAGDKLAKLSVIKLDYGKYYCMADKTREPSMRGYSREVRGESLDRYVLLIPILVYVPIPDSDQYEQVKEEFLTLSEDERDLLAASTQPNIKIEVYDRKDRNGNMQKSFRMVK